MNIPKTPNPLHDPVGYRKAMDSQPAPVPAVMKCGQCGTKARAKRCPKCGSTQMHPVPLAAKKTVEQRAGRPMRDPNDPGDHEFR